MIFIYQIKRYRFNKDILIIYINVLYNKKLFYLIYLFIVEEHSQKVFQYLILTFYLIIYLKMKYDV